MMNPDTNAIEAVKQGDRDRFAELVERHKRMVYAIAWSYLGDAELCEDAAQESFIRAFRYLRALRNPERFVGWLARIVRNVSASLLRRRRTELEHHRRWQTEQPNPVTSPQATDEDESLKETLSRTLGKLSPLHRECLVLFYMEGKSISEAAAVLGISETAMKTRLHRARRALRGRLEQQIQRTLDGLEPRKNFAASVMVLLPQAPVGVAGVGGGASLLAKGASWLANLFPMLMFTLWLTLGQAAVFFLIMRWYARLEAANIINKPENDFRKTLLRRHALTMAFGALFVLAYALFATRYLGYATYFQIVAIYCAWGAYRTSRLLRVNRSPFVWGQILGVSLFLVVFVLIGFFGGTLALFLVAMLLMNLVVLRTNKDAPRRHDYNLFLRQANGTLGGTLGEPENGLPASRALTEPEFRAFARFLGGQWLVRDYSIRGAALLLRLPPVRTTFFHFILTSALGRSMVKIQADGTCRALLSRTDAKAIEALIRRPIDAKTLEAGVGRVVQGALVLFLRGEQAEARHLLTTLDDEAIFITDFGKTRGYRLQHGISIAASLILLIAVSFDPGAWRFSGPIWFQAWKGIPVSQAKARRAVGEWIREDRPAAHPQLLYLWLCPLHPSLALIGKENEAGYKRAVMDALRGDTDDRTAGAIESRIVNGLLRPNLLYHAMTTPILSAEELAALGFDTPRVRKTLVGFKPNMPDKLFELRQDSFQRVMNQRPMLDHQVPLQIQSFKTIDIQTFAVRLWVLKAFDCLDFVDRETLARTIAGHQVNRDFHIPSGFSPVDPALSAGLFNFGMCSLSETWAGLWALETLGRLDLINREECIQGILRFYQGKGIFRANDPRLSGVMITGSEDDAFYAMESLARLNALDRIEDFQKWEFHPVTQTVTVYDRTSPGHVTAAALCSWAYQERLQRYQKELSR